MVCVSLIVSHLISNNQDASLFVEIRLRAHLPAYDCGVLFQTNSALHLGTSRCFSGQMSCVIVVRLSLGFYSNATLFNRPRMFLPLFLVRGDVRTLA